MCSKLKLPGNRCLVNKDTFHFGHLYLFRKDLDLSDCSAWCCSLDVCLSFDWAPSNYTESTHWKQCYLYGDYEQNYTVIDHTSCGEFSHYFNTPKEIPVTRLFLVIMMVPLALCMLFCTWKCNARHRKRRMRIKIPQDGDKVEPLIGNVEETCLPRGVPMEVNNSPSPFTNTVVPQNIPAYKRPKRHLVPLKYDDRMLSASVPIANTPLENMQADLTNSTLKTDEKTNLTSPQPSRSPIPLPKEARKWPEPSECQELKSDSSGGIGWSTSECKNSVRDSSDSSATQYSVGTLPRVISNISVEDRLQLIFRKANLGGFQLIRHEQIKIVSRIGNGNSGEIWLGKYCYMDVAVKTCKKKWEEMTRSEQDAFIRELELYISSGGHQNIIRFYGYCTEPNVWIVMEYCKPVLDLWPRLNFSQMLEILIGLARGLSFIHRHNVIHRDIAARNLLIGADGQTKIIDFGRAKLLEDSDTHASEKTQNFGPIKWMSPEQILYNTYSEKSDVWSFGITAWEIYTGQEPFPRINSLDAAKLIIRGEHPNVSFLPSHIQRILKATWIMDAAIRPTIEEILEELTALRNNPGS